MAPVKPTPEIEALKKRLQKLAADKTMTMAEKKQELKEIIELMIKGAIGWIVDPQVGIGSVDADIFAHPVVIDDEQFGQTNPLVFPFVAQFHFREEEETHGPNVDSRIKKAFFNDYPEFVCNLVSSSGSTFPSTFCDPRSHWYNVFLGYYEIKCYKSKGWKRPFGYVQKDGKWVIHKEDFGRLCAADWNYLSLFTYGVPFDICQRYVPEKTGLIENLDHHVKYNGRLQIFKGNPRWFDEVELLDMKTTSPYESKAPNARKLNWENVYFTIFWMIMFGLPLEEDISDQFPKSFPESRMHGKEWVSFYERNNAWHTFISGGFTNDGNPPNIKPEVGLEFIDVQRQGCEVVINEHYPKIGFPTQNAQEGGNSCCVLL